MGVGGQVSGGERERERRREGRESDDNMRSNLLLKTEGRQEGRRTYDLHHTRYVTSLFWGYFLSFF